MARRLQHNLGRHADRYAPDPAASARLREKVNLDDYDVVVVRYLLPCARLGLAGSSRVIIDVDDLDSGVYRSRAEAPNTPLAKRLWYKARHIWPVDRITRRLISQAGAAWVANEHDVELLGLSNMSALPNIPYVALEGWPDVAPRSVDGDSVLTVASMTHGPNARGVDWFLETAWSDIRSVAPGLRYRIVGSGMSEEQRQRWGRYEGVEPVGFVEDLSSEYARSLFSIAPIHEGGGTKIKVLESLAYGRTAVVTAHAHTGLDSHLVSGESLLAVEDRQFADACVALVRDSELRWSLAASGREVVRQHYSPERFFAVVRQTVAGLVGRPSGTTQ